MLSVVLVAGKETANVERFLASKHVKIVERYKNLYPHKEELFTKYTEADRLLYICYEDSENFTLDLQVISELLKNYNNMFKFKTIIFCVEKNNRNAMYPEYIKTIADSFNGKFDIKINVKNEKIPMTEIYEMLLGRSDELLNRETRERIYIKPRGVDIKAVYEKDRSTTFLEPFNYNSVNSYDRNRQRASQIGSGEVVNEAEEVTVKFDNPDLGATRFDQKLGLKNVIIFTGRPANGTTTYFNATCVSLTKARKNTLMVNLTNDDSYFRYLGNLGASSNVECTEWSLQDMLLHGMFEYSNYLCALSLHDVPNDIKIDALRHLMLNLGKASADFIVIEVPVDLVDEVARLVRHRLRTIFYVTESVLSELEKIMEHISVLNERYNVSVWLNNQVRVRYKQDCKSIAEVMDKLPAGVSCIEDVMVTDYNLTSEIYDNLIKEE